MFVLFYRFQSWTDFMEFGVGLKMIVNSVITYVTLFYNVKMFFEINASAAASDY